MSQSANQKLLIEDRDLLNRIIHVLDKGSSEWKMFYKIGNELTGLMRPVELDMNKDFEFIRRPGLP